MSFAPMDDFRTRAMTPDEVRMAIDWAADEGWNPGLHDAACFRVADPAGFLLGMLGDEPVATLSVVRYGETFGFLGLYIVKPPYRGRGYGLRLWDAGLAHLSRRTIGLDGVVAQQANYRRSGFELAYRNIRYEGKRDGPPARDSRVVPLSTLPFDAVNAYDTALFPADRSRFLESWIAQPQSSAIGIVKDGALAGYGVVRAARSGYKIGPLFADDRALAEALFDALAAGLPGDATIYLDTPETNPDAVALAEHRGMKKSFETARMYAGPAPDLPIPRIYGVTSFELG